MAHTTSVSASDPGHSDLRRARAEGVARGFLPSASPDITNRGSTRYQTHMHHNGKYLVASRAHPDLVQKALVEELSRAVPAEHAVTVLAKGPLWTALVRGRGQRALLTSPIVVLGVQSREYGSAVCIAAYPNLFGLVLGVVVSLIWWGVFVHPTASTDHAPPIVRALMVLGTALPLLQVIVPFFLKRVAAMEQGRQLVGRAILNVAGLEETYRT